MKENDLSCEEDTCDEHIYAFSRWESKGFHAQL